MLDPGDPSFAPTVQAQLDARIAALTASDPLCAALRAVLAAVGNAIARPAAAVATPAPSRAATPKVQGSRLKAAVTTPAAPAKPLGTRAARALERETAALAALKTLGPVSGGTIAQHIGSAQGDTATLLRGLATRGLVHSTGAGRTFRWHLGPARAKEGH